LNKKNQVLRIQSATWLGKMIQAPPCRVLQRFEPAFASHCPTRQISLGRSLSHYCRKSGLLCECWYIPQSAANHVHGRV